MGREIGDAMSRTQTRTAAGEVGQHGVELTLDLQKAREHLDPFKLRAAAQCGTYPLAALLTAFRMRTWERRLVFDGAASRRLRPDVELRRARRRARLS